MNERISTKTLVTFSILDGLYWAYYACFGGYISTYLLACGMTSSVLSIVMAVFMGCSFIGAFFWGGLCDKKKTNKKVFIPEFALSFTSAFISWFMASRSLPVSCIFYILFGFLSAPLGSNLDSWMLKSFYKDAGTYGKARAIGSAGYAVAALLVGQLINRIGYTVMPAGMIACAAVVLVLAVSLKEMEYGNAPAQTEKVNTMDLIKIRPYVFMLVILFTTGLASSPINSLKIVVIQSVGGDVGILGIDSFIGVMIQALFIFSSGKLKKIPPYFRLFTMAFFVMLDMVLIVTAVNPAMVIMGSVMWNASYGVMLPTIRELTERYVHGPLKNTAHSMCDAIYGSFAGIIALTYSGTMMDRFGARSVAVLGLCIMVIPFAMSLVSLLKNAKES